MQVINWVLPLSLSSGFTKSRILKSSTEQGPYSFLMEIDTWDPNGVPVTTFTDMSGDMETFYMIKYYNPTTMIEYADFSLGFFPFTPREKRLLGYISGWVPDVIKPDLSDFDVGYALRLAMNDFNIHPPETNFTIATFPMNYEQFLIAGTQMHIVLQKYLKVAIRDYSFNDSGLSMTLDRGAKMVKAKDDVVAQWQAVIALAKWNFINAGIGLGTVPLPISLGGNLNRGVLGLLDVSSLLGR